MTLLSCCTILFDSPAAAAFVSLISVSASEIDLADTEIGMHLCNTLGGCVESQGAVS